MIELARIEVLKLRRSLLSLVLVACPLAVVALMFAVQSRRGGVTSLSPVEALALWQNVSALWCYFMLPLLMGLVAALINGQEHRNGGWTIMFTQPIIVSQLFLAKSLVAWGCVVAAGLWLAMAHFALASAVGSLPSSTSVASAIVMLTFILKLMLTCIPALVIQMLVGWLSTSLVMPLGLAILATMMATVFGASDYWPWFPWSYMLLASNGSSAVVRASALGVAGMTAITLAITSAWLVSLLHVKGRGPGSG